MLQISGQEGVQEFACLHGGAEGTGWSRQADGQAGSQGAQEGDVPVGGLIQEGRVVVVVTVGSRPKRVEPSGRVCFLTFAFTADPVLACRWKSKDEPT